MNSNSPQKTSTDKSKTPVLSGPSCSDNNPSAQENKTNTQDVQIISGSNSAPERGDGVTSSETIKSSEGKRKEMSKDKSETHNSNESMKEPESPKLPGLPSFDKKRHNLKSPLPSSSGSGDKKKDGVPLSEGIKSRGKKTVTMESFAEYMRKRFGIDNIENLASSKSVTRSGKEYGSNPAKELAKKKKRSSEQSAETLQPKTQPAKRKKLAVVTPSDALKNAKPKKNLVSHVPGHT